MHAPFNIFPWLAALRKTNIMNPFFSHSGVFYVKLIVKFWQIISCGVNKVLKESNLTWIMPRGCIAFQENYRKDIVGHFSFGYFICRMVL